MEKKPLAVYIHIPFCRSKCVYCDFLSFPYKYPVAGDSTIESYFKALESEIKRDSSFFNNYYIKSIFFGGGTPTIAPATYLCRVLDNLNMYFDMGFPQIEISIEANPESVSFCSLKELNNAGINRLSLGVQSFSDDILKRIGRAHNSAGALRAYENAIKAGFKNINIDIMFALPSQNMNDLSETLNTALSLSPTHISAYGLTLMEGSALFNDKSFMPLDDETDREMYYIIKGKLKSAGYSHYEISNFALQFFECQHNIAYWDGTDYIGFGLGAHSFIEGERFHNTENIDSYLAGSAQKQGLCVLTQEDKYSEFFILGLRMIEGVYEYDFYKRFGVSVESIYSKQLKKLENDSLLIRKGGNIKLTSKGIDLSNIVFENFI